MDNSTHFGTCIRHGFCWFANQNESEKKIVFWLVRFCKLDISSTLALFVRPMEYVRWPTVIYIAGTSTLLEKKLEPLYITYQNRSVENDFFHISNFNNFCLSGNLSKFTITIVTLAKLVKTCSTLVKKKNIQTVSLYLSVILELLKLIKNLAMWTP